MSKSESGWSTFHADAGRGRQFRCKVCDLLAGLPKDHATQVREALADEQISELAIERNFKRLGTDIGRTSVRTHRMNGHA